MKKLMCLILSAVLMLGVFAGCASQKQDADATDYSTMTIEELKPLIKTMTSGKLTMVTSPDFAPYEFYALGENNKPTLAGFDIALAHYIADFLGLELEIIPMDFDGTITELQEPSSPDQLWAWKYPPEEDGKISYRPIQGPVRNVEGEDYYLIKLAGDVRFDHVDFAYEEGKTILHDISLFAKPGQKLAFVGATGAGKTTITNLINRFYDIADGKIRYDGISINNIRKPDLRRSLGIVLQDTNLFTGTVRENIRYGNLDATDEEVEAAAALANADDFIRRLPQGYDTMLTGNGANLSQGQRQLLAIARAAVADPPVMILDEATSSIDTRTEAIVQQGMDSLMYGRTVFVIAHRLSTVRNSKAIMVLEQGSIIERGDHEDLLAQHGRYYQLYTGQAELA